MKKTLIIMALMLLTNVSFAQKKDKIKGSKIVTVAQKKIQAFDMLEVTDEIEIVMKKGTECGLEIEADDNLHEVISTEIVSGKLKIGTTKDIISSKKTTINITYTDNFKQVTVSGKSSIIALSDLELQNVEFVANEQSKLFLNAKVGDITIKMNDKSSGELNIRSNKATISLTKNAKMKALIASSEMLLDMYQKADAIVEGDANILKLRLDNNSKFVGKNLTTEDADLLCEGYSTATVNVAKTLKIAATGKSEIYIYGNSKIDLAVFTENAILYKK